MSLSTHPSSRIQFDIFTHKSKINRFLNLSISLTIFGSLFCAPRSVAQRSVEESSSSKSSSSTSITTSITTSKTNSPTNSSTTSTTAHPLDTAQKYYESGDMKHALQFISLTLKQEPSNATAHYLMANCLLKLGRALDANREYYAAESLAPRSKIAEYSRTARTQINAMQKVQPKNSTSLVILSDDDDDEATEDDKKSAASNASNASTASKMTDAKNANAKISNTKNTAGNTSVPPGTLELIRQQAALAKRMAVENGAAEAESERQKGIYEARSLQEKAERMAARPAGSNEPINVSPEERERIKAEAATTGERLKQIGNWKASIVEEWSHEKSNEIQRQAENLQEQLIDNRPSNMKLNPVGTNLYIRNYAKPPLTPLHAEAKSISTKTTATLSSKQTGLTLHSNAGQRTTGVANHRSQTVVTVEGKVLPGD